MASPSQDKHAKLKSKRENQMQINKTVSKPGIDGNRKDYAIYTTCGRKFYAKAIGSHWYECGGVNFDSLRAIKDHIEAGGFEDGSSVQPMRGGN